MDNPPQIPPKILAALRQALLNNKPPDQPNRLNEDSMKAAVGRQYEGGYRDIDEATRMRGPDLDLIHYAANHIMPAHPPPPNFPPVESVQLARLKQAADALRVKGQ